MKGQMRQCAIKILCAFKSAQVVSALSLCTFFSK